MRQAEIPSSSICRGRYHLTSISLLAATICRSPPKLTLYGKKLFLTFAKGSSYITPPHTRVTAAQIWEGEGNVERRKMCTRVVTQCSIYICRGRYYTVSDHPDLSDAGDLSWDEGDLPRHEIKVELLLILSEFGGNIGVWGQYVLG